MILYKLNLYIYIYIYFYKNENFNSLIAWVGFRWNKKESKHPSCSFLIRTLKTSVQWLKNLGRARLSPLSPDYLCYSRLHNFKVLAAQEASNLYYKRAFNRFFSKLCVSVDLWVQRYCSNLYSQLNQSISRFGFWENERKFWSEIFTI